MTIITKTSASKSTRITGRILSGLSIICTLFYSVPLSSILDAMVWGGLSLRDGDLRALLPFRR